MEAAARRAVGVRRLGSESALERRHDRDVARAPLAVGEGFALCVRPCGAHVLLVLVILLRGARRVGDERSCVQVGGLDQLHAVGQHVEDAATLEPGGAGARPLEGLAARLRWQQRVQRGDKLVLPRTLLSLQAGAVGTMHLVVRARFAAPARASFAHRPLAHRPNRPWLDVLASRDFGEGGSNDLECGGLSRLVPDVVRSTAVPQSLLSTIFDYQAGTGA